MKYIFTIMLSLTLIFPVYASASVTDWQDVTTGEGSNAGNISTGIEGVVMSAPTANPPAGTYTEPKSVILSAPGSDSIHYFLNTTDFNEALTCSTGATTTPVTVNGSALLRAIACYGDTAGPLASFSYKISSETEPATPSGGGGGNSGGGGGGYVPPATPPATNPADFNNSGTVDILDFNILIMNWGSTSATKATGDANGDKKVDIFDFNILITNWQF